MLTINIKGIGLVLKKDRSDVYEIKQLFILKVSHGSNDGFHFFLVNHSLAPVSPLGMAITSTNLAISESTLLGDLHYSFFEKRLNWNFLNSVAKNIIFLVTDFLSDSNIFFIAIFFKSIL
jgi:hypothetical protein